ncbi:hypothetical protein [Streptomyces antimycoticus]|uniref:hypothetical protein n=1 Tax=Streptomyces antimycoticus TaxID=68175 RepID=UPI0030B85AD4
MVVFSHGHGAANFLSSLRGYGPLVDFWAGHLFGGISGYDAAETPDENPARVAALRALVLSYLRSQLLGDRSWETAVNLLPSLPILAATVEAK